MKQYYSKRFKLGESRYMTRATIENGYIIIQQSERLEHPKIDSRNSFTLSIADFKDMIKKLGI